MSASSILPARAATNGENAGCWIHRSRHRKRLIWMPESHPAEGTLPLKAKSICRLARTATQKKRHFLSHDGFYAAQNHAFCSRFPSGSLKWPKSDRLPAVGKATLSSLDALSHAW